MKILKFFDFKNNTGIYKIRSIQTSIDTNKSNLINLSMLNGNYDFKDKNNIIAYYFINNKYIVTEGNHQMFAALTIWKETGEYSFVENLLKYGIKYNINLEPTNFAFKL
jgi:hypothetical protein